MDMQQLVGSCPKPSVQKINVSGGIYAYNSMHVQSK